MFSVDPLLCVTLTALMALPSSQLGPYSFLQECYYHFDDVCLADA